MSKVHPPESQYRRYDDISFSTISLIPGGWMAAGLAASCAAVAMLMAMAGLTIAPNALFLSYGVMAVAASAICYRLRDADGRWQRLLRDGVENFSLFALISLLGALATYPLSAGTQGFADPLLQRFDSALHFDWMAWYGVVAASPLLQDIERTAYLSIFVTPLLLLGFFTWEGRRAEARMFIATFWLAAVITMILFVFVPAEGPLIFLGHGHIPYMPFSGLHEQHDILALRGHLLHRIDLGALHGLVSAPSFHAASGVLFIAAGWRIRRLRWPVTITSGAMLLATPVEGTHYLIDIIAGAAVAIGSLRLMPLLVRMAIGHERHQLHPVLVPAE